MATRRFRKRPEEFQGRFFPQETPRVGTPSGRQFIRPPRGGSILASNPAEIFRASHEQRQTGRFLGPPRGTDAVISQLNRTSGFEPSQAAMDARERHFTQNLRPGGPGATNEEIRALQREQAGPSPLRRAEMKQERELVDLAGGPARDKLALEKARLTQQGEQFGQSRVDKREALYANLLSDQMLKRYDRETQKIMKNIESKWRAEDRAMDRRTENATLANNPLELKVLEAIADIDDDYKESVIDMFASGTFTMDKFMKGLDRIQGLKDRLLALATPEIAEETATESVDAEEERLFNIDNNPGVSEQERQQVMEWQEAQRQKYMAMTPEEQKVAQRDPAFRRLQMIWDYVDKREKTNIERTLGGI